LDQSFLTYASNIIADTQKGLSGSQIISLCVGYAVDNDVKLPYSEYPFVEPIKKSVALNANLKVFPESLQFMIIKEILDMEMFKNNDDAKSLRQKLFSKYGYLTNEKFSDGEIAQKTKNWLQDYPDALKQYNNALQKYEGGIYTRNTLDDIRLSFEYLLRALLKNTKTLGNQKDELGKELKNRGVSTEIRNMLTTIIQFNITFQDCHVKHHDSLNDNEVEYIIEQTSIIMKLLIKIFSQKETSLSKFNGITPKPKRTS